MERLDRGENEEQIAKAMDVNLHTVRAVKAQGWDRVLEAEALREIKN